MHETIENLAGQMTLEEKASLCSGKNFWYLKGIERLGIPSVMVTDGPHGLRKQEGDADHLGLNVSVKATCFPPAVTSASSWNPELLKQVGTAIGEEAAWEEAAVVLGPGINIKRSPLCGRNFEYFSEDPYLAGELAAAWVSGVQSQGVGTSLKHFAANNQEKCRLAGNSAVDPRALREIYLTAFEKVVKQARPWTMMCSYNRINGVYSCENPWLLDQVLRKEWGFDGLVMTDWGAMDQRVEALNAGLDLEMPGPADWNDKKIVEAVRSGAMEEAVLDRAVKRILTLIAKASQAEKKPYDQPGHHLLAREAAAESCVLLKNEGVLPLDKEKHYAVLGAFATHPRYQGAGSSKINPHQVDSVLAELDRQQVSYTYAPGYSLDAGGDAVQENLIREAREAAEKADGVIVFAGLPDFYESEGFDRTHLDMPKSHCALIEAAAAVNAHVTVVLMCGSAVLMPWRDRVQGILLAYLSGESVGGACVDVLTGVVNPSGHLAETFPLSLEDTPCRDYFAGEGLNVEYRESILAGYRYYDWAEKEVAYPFGYGLSYTEFSLDDMHAEWDDDSQTGLVRVTVTNTGDRDGSQVVQLYIGKTDSAVMRAPRELKGFSKVRLAAGESKTIELPLDFRSFAYYSPVRDAWTLEDGWYQIYAGISSRDLPLKTEVAVCGTCVEPEPGYDRDTSRRAGRLAVTEEAFARLFGGTLPLIKEETIHTVNARLGEVMADSRGRQLFGKIIEQYTSAFDERDEVGRMMLAMTQDLPLRSLASFGVTGLETIEELVRIWNEDGN